MIVEEFQQSAKNEEKKRTEKKTKDDIADFDSFEVVCDIKEDTN